MATVKGAFIKAHVKRVEKEKGKEGVETLEKLYGKSLNFNNLRDYDTQDEEKLIKACLKMMEKDKPGKDPDVLAGRFHFETFAETLLGKTSLKLAINSPQEVFKVSQSVFPIVLKGADIEFIEEDKKTIKLIIKNAGYAPRHFEGFFKAVLDHKNIPHAIVTRVNTSNEYEYLVTFK